MSMEAVQQSIAANTVLQVMDRRDRKPVMRWLAVLERFEAAENKGDALAALQREYAPVMRISQGTFYRKRTAWLEDGIYGLLPAKWRRAMADNAPLPLAFLEFWQEQCFTNQRKTSAAYRSLFWDYLLAGRVIPGYETDWEGIYLMEHPGHTAPARCPYFPHECTPRGWSERNLRNYAPGNYQLIVARQGRAAGRALLPKLPSTRVGLPFGRVFIMDDVEHDVLVKFAGNRNAHHVVELGAVELLTGHYCTFGCKPVRERADGTREKLRESYTRYLLADIACRIGFSRDGCLICGEHGTARVAGDLLQTLNKWAPDTFDFDAGGKLHHPILKGMFHGIRRGNFRFKAALESHHNLKKNDLAQLPGQKGADPEHMPEDLESKKQYHRFLTAVCAAVAERDPEVLDKIRSPFPAYYDYLQAIFRIYDRIAMRTRHALEGWEECGFTIEQWRTNETDVWKPLAELDAMEPDEQKLVKALIRRDPERRHRVRLMSPAEAFAYRRSRDAEHLMRLPDAAVPDILGPDLGQTLPVRQEDKVLLVRDEYLPGKTYPVVGLVTQPDGSTRSLDRGSKWLVHLSPFDGAKAYVSTTGGAFVGTAPVMIPGTKGDAQAARRNLGIIAQVEADELKPLARHGVKLLAEQAEMREHNVQVLTGRDPVGDAHRQAALVQAAGKVDLTEGDMAAAFSVEREEEMDLDEITGLLGRE